MAVVSIASAKGGVGKSTLAILLGAEFALDGYKVAVLDADLNQHTAAFGLKCTLPNLRVIPDIGEKEILKALREAEAENDIVLVDLPGAVLLWRSRRCSARISSLCRCDHRCRTRATR